jgi:hypothetical protein
MASLIILLVPRVAGSWTTLLYGTSCFVQCLVSEEESAEAHSGTRIETYDAMWR